MLLLKKYKDALEDAEKTIELKSDWAKGYSRKVTALHYLGRLEDAEKVANEGLKIEPGNLQLKQSIEDIKKAKSQELESESGSEELFSNLFKGDVFGKLASNPETAKFLTQPDFVQTIKKLQANPKLLSSFMQDTRVMQSLGVLIGVPMRSGVPEDFKDVEMKEEKESKSPQSIPKKEEKKQEEKKDVVMEDLPEEKKQAEEEKAKGNSSYSKKEFDNAISHYSKAIELDPQNVVYYTNRAAAQFEKGDYQAAIKDCETAIEEGRKQRVDYKLIAKAYARIANSFMKLDNIDQAVYYYEKSLTEDRTAATLTLLNKAEKIKVERDTKAYLSVEKSLEAKELGNKLFSDGKYPDAIKEYSEAIKRNPEDHTLYSNRSASYTKLGEYNLALKDAETCISKKPDFVKGYSRKGLCYFFMKDYQKALEAYDKGLTFDPNNVELSEGVKKTMNAMAEQTRKAQSGDAPDEETLKKSFSRSRSTRNFK